MRLNITIVPLIVLAAAPALTPQVSAQTLLRSVNGPAAGAQFGKACITVPDQNGDGVKDVLVGAPEFNGGRGAIYCISGAYLATGFGAQTLWSLAPTANPGDRFGAALVVIGDVTNDGVHDFVVGQPGYDSGTLSDLGAVRLVNGFSRLAVSTLHGDSQGSRFGSAIAVMGDVDADGKSEILVGAPGRLSGAGAVHLVEGADIAVSGPVPFTSFPLAGGVGDGLGESVTAVYENLGGGAHVSRFFVGVPGWDGPTGLNTGKIVYGSMGGFIGPLLASGEYSPAIGGERFGASLDAAHDYDGDGAIDVVIGAPNSKNGTSFEVGRVVVASGARLGSNNPPYDLYVFSGGAPPPPASHAAPDPNFHFGAAVRACPDLNSDGVGEILIGAPDYFTPGTSGGFNFRGFVRIISGASGAQLTNISGASTDRLGAGLGSVVGDFDGDGFDEFVVAGALSDAGGVDSGVVKCYRLFPLAPWTYCTGKLNSLGCVPAIASSGTPSASSGAPFTISVANLINQKNGLLFYSHRPTAALFQGGTLCVASPSVRTPTQNSGGAATGSSCTGAFSFDFNAWFASGFDPALAAGSEVYAQHWSRDPASPSKTGLSNALSFVLHP